MSCIIKPWVTNVPYRKLQNMYTMHKTNPFQYNLLSSDAERTIIKSELTHKMFSLLPENDIVTLLIKMTALFLLLCISGNR